MLPRHANSATDITVERMPIKNAITLNVLPYVLVIKSMAIDAMIPPTVNTVVATDIQLLLTFSVFWLLSSCDIITSPFQLLDYLPIETIISIQ